MKKKRYSDEQIVRILREADKDSVAEVATRRLPCGVQHRTYWLMNWHLIGSLRRFLHTEFPTLNNT